MNFLFVVHVGIKNGILMADCAIPVTTGTPSYQITAWHCDPHIIEKQCRSCDTTVNVLSI